MIRINNKIWIEVSDWETLGIKHKSVVEGVSKGRKSWSKIVKQGKGKSTLYLYDSLCDKHKALFKETVEHFVLLNDTQEQAQKEQQKEQEVEEMIKSMIQAKPSDIQYFLDNGFDGTKSPLATKYALRASWLELLNMPKHMMKAKLPLKTKEELYRICTKLVYEAKCFNLTKPSMQYLRRLAVNYKKKGLQACIDQRQFQTPKNSLKLEPHVQEFLLLIVKSLQKPTAMQVFETYRDFIEGKRTIINRDTGELYEPSNFPSFVYDTIRRFMNRPVISAYYSQIHSSALFYKDNHAPYLHRSRPDFFCSMITCDDWDIPIDLVSGKKLKLYLFFDVATRRCIGVSHSFKKDKNLFLEGLKATLENDELAGKMPWELQGEAHLLSNLKDTILADGELFQKVTILPKNPMAKYAERDIKDMKYTVLQKDPRFAIYFKGRHYAKQEAYNIGDSQGKTEKLPDHQIEGFVTSLVETWNQKHSLKPMSSELMDQNEERLAYHLGYTKHVTIRNAVFTCQNANWEFDQQADLESLHTNYIEVRVWKDKAFVYQKNLLVGKAHKVRKAKVGSLEKTALDKAIEAEYYQKQQDYDKVLAKIETGQSLFIDHPQADWELIDQPLELEVVEDKEQTRRDRMIAKYYKDKNKKIA